MLDRLRRRLRATTARLRRFERRELREFRRWAETTDRLVHLSVLVFVPLLIGLVTALANALPRLTFLLFPPLASGTYTLFVDPGGRYSNPKRFVAGLTIGAACGLGALWLSSTLLAPPAGLFQVSAPAAALSVLATGAVTWALDIEEPSAYATALLALLVQPDQRFVFLGSIVAASSLVAFVFVVWRRQFYEQRAAFLYESTQGDDHVLVPMRGEHAEKTAMLAGRLAAAHEAGKVVLLDLVADEDAAAAERALLDEAGGRRAVTSKRSPGEVAGGQAGQASAEVVDEQIAADSVRAQVDRLETHADRIETRVGVPCQVVVATGDGSPAATTLQTARTVNCDLIAAPYESEHGALTGYLRRLFDGDADVLVHRSRNDRTSWKRVLVPVRWTSDVAHSMLDFAVRLAGRTGRIGVATCIGDRGNRRRAEEMLANLVDPFAGAIETRVAQTDIQSFLAATGPQYDLVFIGASRDRSVASRLVSPPTFERIEDVETDVAIVDRNRP